MDGIWLCCLKNKKKSLMGDKRKDKACRVSLG